MEIQDLGVWDTTKEPAVRKYDLSLEEIPRLSCNSPLLNELISNNRPVVITDSHLVQVACAKWTLEYLEEHLGNADHTVFASKNYKFKYFDDKKILSPSNLKGVAFTPPTNKCEMKISEFMKKLKEWKIGDDRIYLQQSLTSSVDACVIEDFTRFNWAFANHMQKMHNWGVLTSNLLLISLEGNVTPCHYDEQQNFFAQVKGQKRCILFPPHQFDCLYPHPVYHPHDRQSMVDFDNPDHERFPKFCQAKGYETIVSPGDVLYIPIYWWHQIESLLCGPSISVNFWYKDSPPNLHYPLKEYQKVSIMRNVEKMLTNVLQRPDEVGPMLRAIVLGRYTEE